MVVVLAFVAHEGEVGLLLAAADGTAALLAQHGLVVALLAGLLLRPRLVLVELLQPLGLLVNLEI